MSKGVNADEYYCNSVEYANILNAKKWLNKYRNNCKKYIEILKMRVLQELEKTKLVTDVNKAIVSFL